MATTNNARAAAWIQSTLQQGLNFLNTGEIDRARECVGKVLEVSQDSSQAHFLAGLIAISEGQRDSALGEFRDVAKLEPQNPAAWAHIAQICVETGRHDEAFRALKRAIKYNDDSPNVQQIVGTVLSMLGEHTEALTWYERASAQQPTNIGFLLNHAQCLMFIGRIDDAERVLQHVLRVQPAIPNAHWLLSGLKPAKDKSHITQMQQLISSGRYPPASVAYLHYACGKELEDVQDWSAAFESFAAGATARRTTVAYDEQAEADMFDSLQRVFTRRWFEAADSGFEDVSPIFVVGQPRSGTTLVERIISSHSRVHSAGELRYFADSIMQLIDGDAAQNLTPELAERAAKLDYARLGKLYAEKARRFTSTTIHFVDKLPSNYLYIPLILKALPNAKIVHLRRGPMDSCFSAFKQLFLSAYEYSYDQGEVARHYARYHHLMEVWRERFGHDFYEVTYEDLARDTESNAQALLEFLQLPWEDSCLTFYESKSAVSTASAVQVRQPVHTKSIGRWRRYEDELSPIRSVLESHGVPLEFS